MLSATNLPSTNFNPFTWRQYLSLTMISNLLYIRQRVTAYKHTHARYYFYDACMLVVITKCSIWWSVDEFNGRNLNVAYSNHMNVILRHDKYHGICVDHMIESCISPQSVRNVFYNRQSINFSGYSFVCCVIGRSRYNFWEWLGKPFNMV